MLFKGKSKNLYLAYAGAGRALLLIINPESTNTFSDPTIELIFHALEEIRAVENLDQLVSSIANPASAPVSQPVSPAADTQTLPASTKPSETVMPIESEVAPEVLKQVEEHFELVTQNRLAPKQVEDFWNAAMEDDEARNAMRPNDINYDEARRLGLAPDEDCS
jgi:hypothetical protein